MGLKPDLRGGGANDTVARAGLLFPTTADRWALAFIPLLSEEGCPVGAGWLVLTLGLAFGTGPRRTAPCCYAVALFPFPV